MGSEGVHVIICEPSVCLLFFIAREGFERRVLNVSRKSIARNFETQGFYDERLNI